MISICLPTRGRPEAFKRMCTSVLDTVSNPDDIEFVSYHDNDDPSVYEYIGNHKEVVGERIFQMQMLNECYKVATGPLYMLMADDMVFETKDWDKYVMDVFDQSSDKILFVHTNDKYHRSRYGQTGFLHKNWIETVGYFLPPYFVVHYGDWWLNDVSVKINRRIFLRTVVVKHLWGENQSDQTHLECLQRAQEANVRAIYHSEEMIEKRDKDAKLLQDFIDNFK